MALTLSFSHFPGLLPGLSKRKAFGLKDQLLRNFKRCNLGDSRSPFGLMFHRWFGIKTRQENEGKKLFPALHLHASIFMPQSSCLNLHASIFMPQSSCPHLHASIICRELADKSNAVRHKTHFSAFDLSATQETRIFFDYAVTIASGGAHT
jgi:hypothetical protein